MPTAGVAGERDIHRLAVLTNQYPRPSHTFIRREIHAFERLGVDVIRVSVRTMRGELVEAADVEERGRTVFLLSGRPGSLKRLYGGASRNRRADWRGAAEAVRALRVEGGPGACRIGAYLGEALILRELCRARGVDHVHVHFGTNPAAVAMLCRVMGGPPYSFTAHGPEEFERPEALSIAAKARHASSVVCVTEHGVDRMRSICGGEDGAKIALCRSGVSDVFLAADAVDVPGTRALAFVGRLAAQKDPLLLLRAFARCAGGVPDAKLTMIGDGPLRGPIESAIRALGLRGRVVMRGWCDEATVVGVMRESRAVVLASRGEGLPAVVMEAGAVGRPAIATDVGGVRELVRDGVTGWLVPPGHERALACAMQACLLAPASEILRRGALAREAVRAGHDVDVQTRRLLRVLRGLE